MCVKQIQENHCGQRRASERGVEGEDREKGGWIWSVCMRVSSLKQSILLQVLVGDCEVFHFYSEGKYKRKNRGLYKWETWVSKVYCTDAH